MNVRTEFLSFLAHASGCDSNTQQPVRNGAYFVSFVPKEKAPPIVSDGAASVRKRETLEWLIRAALMACAGVSVATTIGIIIVLVSGSIDFFREVPIVEFLTETRWTPLFQEKHFGVLPLIVGTMSVAGYSAFIALPIGLAAAIYLSEYAPNWMRSILKPLLEVLAGIPSIVYGFFAIVFVSPLLRWITPDEGPFAADVFNAVNAAIVVSIMILPMVISLSEDVLRSVPRALRDAAYALGSSKFEVITRVVTPAALSGIVASFLLAICRAIGETMAVTLAAGQTAKLTFNPLESIQTMTCFIVQASAGDVEVGSIEYKTVFAVGFTLFVITMTINVFAQWILSRMRERYE